MNIKSHFDFAAKKQLIMVSQWLVQSSVPLFVREYNLPFTPVIYTHCLRPPFTILESPGKGRTYSFYQSGSTHPIKTWGLLGFEAEV